MNNSSRCAPYIADDYKLDDKKGNEAGLGDQAHVDLETKDAELVVEEESGIESEKPFGTPLRGKALFSNVIHKHMFNPTFSEIDARTPEACVELLRTPSVTTLFATKKNISDGGDWLQKFIEAGGVEVLFELIDSMGTHRVTNLETVKLLVEYVACIKAVMNAKQGLDYVIANRDNTRKLVSALDTNDVSVKKQVFELLSAMCVYTSDGHNLVLDSLESFKVSKKQRYRFSLIVNEMKHAELVPYKATLLALINCIVVGTEELEERVRLRNEFLSLDILDILNLIHENSNEEYDLQYDVFFDEKHNDDDALAEKHNEVVDINSHKALFHAIYQKVLNKPLDAVFLSILQTLFQIDTDGDKSEELWKFVDTILRQSTLTETKEARDLLSKKLAKITEGSLRGQNEKNSLADLTAAYATAVPPPPPPPPPPGVAQRVKQVPRMSAIKTPKPSKKMKVISWSKVPAQEILGEGDSFWKTVNEIPDPVTPPYEKIEKLFCKTMPQPKEARNPPVQAHTEVNLLDLKRSMNVNIFLKQLKDTNENIVNMIESGDETKIDVDTLKHMCKLLPKSDEVELLKNYDGNKEKLGPAEKFFLALIGLPGYKVRLEGMLLKLDFHPTIETQKTDINIIVEASKGILENKSMKDFFRFVLQTGNFINSGSYAGDCVGFRFNSLEKLPETRSNKPRVNLLHVLVEEAEMRKKDILSFATDLRQPLNAAEKLSTDNIKSVLKEVKTAISKLGSQVKNSQDDIKKQLTQFLQGANVEMAKVDEKLEEIEELRRKLARHLCEQESTFKLEECLQSFSSFVDKVVTCRKENDERRTREEKAALMKKQREETRRVKGVDVCDGLSVNIVDNLLMEIKQGKRLRKKAAAKADGDVLVGDF